MALYVVQHGLSMPKSEDPEKGLAPAGIRESERIAGVAAGYRVHVSKILHSGKARARQTAEIFGRHLSPVDGIEVCEGVKPLDDVRCFAEGFDVDQDLMLVGHLPFLERLIGLLVCGDPDRLVFKLQNSGIVCLDRIEGKNHLVLRWALMPNVGTG